MYVYVWLGFNLKLPYKSLYRRSEITATGDGLEDPVQAYIYHQGLPKSTKNIINYPNGDWMEVILAYVNVVLAVCSHLWRADAHRAELLTTVMGRRNPKQRKSIYHHPNLLIESSCARINFYPIVE